MNRVYNFSAGPSMLPLEVLEKAQKELVCYGTSGMSVMEMSHRSADFENILNTAKADLKELMKVPDDYEILFVQGGGSAELLAERVISALVEFEKKLSAFPDFAYGIAFYQYRIFEMSQRIISQDFAGVFIGEQPFFS